MQAMKEQFLGRTVQIFPGDTDDKFGEVLDINEAGVTFRITKVNSGNYLSKYAVGEIRFIAFSTGLTFRLVA